MQESISIVSPVFPRRVSPDVIPDPRGPESVQQVRGDGFPVEPSPFLFLGGFSLNIIACITVYQAADRIIEHLKLTFAAEKPPPAHVFEPAALRAAEECGRFFIEG